MGKLTDKVSGRWAVVTGASSGIGLEFSRQLAQMGANVLLISNQAKELQQARCQLESIDSPGHAPQVRTLCVDLADDGAAERVMAEVRALPCSGRLGDPATQTINYEGDGSQWPGDACRGKSGGGPSQSPVLLINNAGIFDFKEVSKLTAERLDLYIDLHMRTLTHLTRVMGQMMADNGGGYILNMSSMSCWMPMPGIAMYSATKAYIRAFTRAYRIEMLDRGVSVTVACPGGIDTDLFGLKPGLRRLAVRIGALQTPRKFVRRALRHTLRGRAQYINGWVNRLAIVGVAATPQWARRLIKTKLLDRLQ